MIRVVILFAAGLIWINSCTHHRADLGSEKNPVKFFFVPSVDVKLLEDTSKVMAAYLEANTPYKFKILIPPSYIAVVEAFGTNRADVAALNTYGYIIAHDKYGAEARLITVRYGETTYQAQFLARSDSKINKLEDLNGKKIAFVDPASVSGYLLPLKYLKDHGIKPKETMFAMRHDNVISMIYQRQVDAGATFYSPPAENQIQDARRLVKAQYPDIESKVKIVALTSPIPNDPIVFRKDMPEDMKKSICDVLIKFAETPEGQTVLKQLSSITGLKPVTDKDYDETRAAVKALGGVAEKVK
jgi:phosphonate transport system substrate-binding protein